MQESVLHMVWSTGYFSSHGLKTVAGQQLQIIACGEHNRVESGPDFSLGTIRLDGLEIHGSIEIHTKASDWNRHQHQHDQAYDDVILHVVYEYDQDAMTSSGRLLPTLCLKGRIPLHLLRNDPHPNWKNRGIACAPLLVQGREINWKHWVERLAIERLERKCRDLEGRHKALAADTDQLVFEAIGIYYQMAANKQGMQLMLQLTPAKIVRRQTELQAIEALLLGQAGFLNGIFTEPQVLAWQQAYDIFRRRYALASVSAKVWKTSGLRPANAPALRLGQYAAMLHAASDIKEAIISCASPEEMNRLLRVETSSYWHEHASVHKVTKPVKSRAPGIATLNNILINAIAPLMFVLGRQHKRNEMVDQALEILSSTAPESNQAIRYWKGLGIKPTNALETQGLLELRMKYCQALKCARCGIGARLLGSTKAFAGIAHKATN